MELIMIGKQWKYKVQRNKVNNMIIHAKQQFFLNSNDFLDENSSDPKLFWSLVKKLMGNVGRSLAAIM